MIKSMLLRRQEMDVLNLSHSNFSEKAEKYIFFTYVKRLSERIVQYVIYLFRTDWKIVQKYNQRTFENSYPQQ